jgi:hypothetical protein
MSVWDWLWIGVSLTSIAFFSSAATVCVVALIEHWGER